MRVVLLLGFLTSLTVSASDQVEKVKCGITISDTEGFMLNAYGYGELESQDQIAIHEALIWEYSNDPYCGTQEYEENLERFFEQEMEKHHDNSESLAPIFRRGFEDKCQYRKIVSADNSPFKFLSKFKRRIHTAILDGQPITWIVHQNQGAIKFMHSTGKHECVRNGI